MVMGVALAAAGLAAAATGAGAGAPGATVVAGGLNNPRALALGPDGAIYVAEAGRAGAKCLDKKGQTCIGTTSAVARISGGKALPVVTGVLSGGARDGTFATGIDGVSVAADGTILMAVTAAPECAPITLPPGLSSQVGRVLAGPEPGAPPHALADLATIECKTNPDGTDRNSNPYGIYALGPDHALVLDAGGNDLLEVTGTKAKVIAVFPKNGKNQSVPTSITKGPDGQFYVGELAEGAGNGKARVFRMVPGSKPTVYKTGFTTITGLAFGPDKSMYVTELTTNTKSQKPSGAVIEVTRTPPLDARPGHPVLALGRRVRPVGEPLRLELQRAAGDHAEEGALRRPRRPGREVLRVVATRHSAAGLAP